MIQDALEAGRQNLGTQTMRRIERLTQRQQQDLSESTIPEAMKSSSDALPPPDLWFDTAFKDLVLDFNVKLPFIDETWPVDENIRWHLAIARDAITEARRTATNLYIASRGRAQFAPFTTFAINNIKLSGRSDMIDVLKEAPGALIRGCLSVVYLLLHRLKSAPELPFAH